MKIGPLQWNRRTVETQDEPPRRAPAELGATGVVNLDGFLKQLEYNDKLKGVQALTTFDQMRRSDGAVAEVLGHIRAPLLNASWRIEPASPDPRDAEIAEFVRRAYFEWLADPWMSYLDEALDYLVFGFSVFETVFDVREAELAFDDPSGEEDVDPETGIFGPKRITVPKRQFLTWRRFAPRLPDTVYRWNEKDGELVSITQRVWKDNSFEELEIPMDRVVLYVNQRRGGDYTGISLIRPAYKHWRYRELIEKVQGVSLERFGVGVPVGYPPMDRKDDAATMDQLKSILKNIRSGEFAYVAMPGPKAQIGGVQNEGWTIEILTPGPNTAPDFTEALQYHRGEIHGSTLTRFASLGHGQTGARATSDTQSEIWQDALHSVARYFCDANNGAIRRLVNANYTDVDAYPCLAVEDIESKNLEEFARAHSLLTGSGAVVPDDPYRKFVRRALDAPPEMQPTEEEEPPARRERIEDDPTDDDPQRAERGMADRVVRAQIEALNRQMEEIARVVGGGAAAHIHLPESLEVKGEIEQAPPPQVTVNVPEQPAPQVTVNVPEQPPPQVNVEAPEVTVNVPTPTPPDVKVNFQVPDEPKRKRRVMRVNRDSEGRLDSAVIQESPDG